MEGVVPASLLAGGRRRPADTVGSDGDDEGSFVAFLQGRAGDVVLLVGGVGVDELEVAGAEHLKAVGVGLAGVEGLGAEAGARVVDFDEADWLRAEITDRGVDIVRVAAGQREGQRGQGQQAGEAHGARIAVSRLDA